MPSERRADLDIDPFDDAPHDPLMARLVRDLATLHVPGSPPACLRASVARSIEVRISAGRARPLASGWRSGRSLPRWTAAVAASLLAALILTGVALALAPIVERALNQDPGTRRIAALDLGRELHLAQTVDGFTMTIERVYADPIQVVVSYRISGPPDRTFANFHPFDLGGSTVPTLTDGLGNQLQPAPLSWGAGVEDGTGQYVEIFDGSGIQGTPKEMTFRLDVPAITAIEQMSDVTPPPYPDEYMCQSGVCLFTVRGPFTFDFAVPFEPGRTTIRPQAVSAGGALAVLERAVTTPTGTRVDLRGVGPTAQVLLSVDGTTYVLRHAGPSPSQWTEDTVWTFTSPESLFERQGAWTLAVTPGPPPAPGAPVVSGGPWIFRVILP